METVLELLSGPGNPRNSEGAFVTLKDGRILYVYTRYNGTSWADHASADLASRVSRDGGRTWSDSDRIVVKNEGNANIMSVSLLRLQDGRIALLYLRKDTQPDGSVTCLPWLRFSVDEAETWSEPQKVVHFPGYCVVNNDRLIQLSSGRLLIPIGFHRYASYRKENEIVVTIDGRSIACFQYSDDSGATWQEATQWIYPPSAQSRTGLQEPGVVELRDGRLLAWFRTDQGCQYKAFSSDQGMTWSAAAPAPEFLSPTAPLSMRRCPRDGRLLAVWCDHSPYWKFARDPKLSWGRTPLALAWSDDDGQTWRDHRLLETDPAAGFCYIAIHFTDDAVLLAYCCGGEARGTGVLQDSRLVRIPF